MPSLVQCTHKSLLTHTSGISNFKKKSAHLPRFPSGGDWHFLMTTFEKLSAFPTWMLKIPITIPLSSINSERNGGKTPNELLLAKSFGCYATFSVEILRRKANSVRILWKSRWQSRLLSNFAEMTRNGQKWSKNVKYAYLPGTIGNSSCGSYDHISKTDAIIIKIFLTLWESNRLNEYKWMAKHYRF